MENKYFNELLFLERKLRDLTYNIACDDDIMEFPGYCYLVSAARLLGECSFFFKGHDESSDRL